MEKFKINIPLETEEEPEEIAEEELEYEGSAKFLKYIFLLLIGIIIGFLLYNIFKTYKEYEVKNIYERSDAIETSYIEFGNNLLKYSSDGVFCTTYSGALIWNYTYDLANPQIDVCDEYVVVFDKKGNELNIFSQVGYISTIKTTMPIIDVNVAKKGTVAILMQQDNVSFLQMYDAAGKMLAAGEIHPEEGGYPVAMALSSDATRLMVSQINLNDGDIKTTINFYDFSSAGKEKTDNIVASYSYLDMIIPRVDFVKGDKAIAFGDNEIIIYNNNANATIVKEIFVQGEMKSIFHNNEIFGYISEGVDEDGQTNNVMTLYNLYGLKCCEKPIENSFKSVSVMSNNRIMFLDEKNIDVYNLQGIHNFSCEAEENVYQLIPGKTSRRYYLIEENKTEEIRMK